MAWLKQIITEALQDETGVYSNTRCWEAVAYLTATIIMLKLTWIGGLSSEYLLIYLGALSTRGGVGKLIDAKYRVPSETK